MASTQYNTLKTRYEQGRISIAMLRKYVLVGRITEEEFKTITGEEY
jgi:uncharacterized XkdX family phage protein